MHYGSCLCGSVKYSIDDNLQFVLNCHCRFCSKAHGAAFTTLLIMPFNNFQVIEGHTLLSSYEVKALNSLRGFCSRCGTGLYNHSPSKGMISLIVATLDTHQELRPLTHINVASKCSWHRITDALPQFSSTPNPSEFGQLRASAATGNPDGSAGRRAELDKPLMCDDLPGECDRRHMGV
jgi:hypothetical protein